MRVGFCCIHLQPDGLKSPLFQNAAATVTHVSKLKGKDRAVYLRRAVDANLAALAAIVRDLANQPANRRMFRITSGLLPLYTHEVAKPIYLDPGYHAEWRQKLFDIGKVARAHAIRLSFHPGQFTVLNSAKEAVRQASIEEFEYHTRCAHYMGFTGGNSYAKLLNGQEAKDQFVINVHGGAWHGDLETSLAAWDWSWARLSRAARRLITLENDEMSWDAASILALCERLSVRMVPDVHHHWVQSGEWLDPDSEFVKRMRRTWGALGPKMHVSMPLPNLLPGGYRDTPLLANRAKTTVLPDPTLPARPEDTNKPALRTHSDYIYHPAMVPYLQRWADAGWDIQVEAKMKNLAADALAASMEKYREHRSGRKQEHVSGRGR